MIIVSIELVQIIQKGGYMILLDMKDRRPIYEQLIEKLADLMLCGALREDE